MKRLADEQGKFVVDTVLHLHFTGGPASSMQGCSGARTEGTAFPYVFVRNDPLWQFLLTFHIVKCLALTSF